MELLTEARQRYLEDDFSGASSMYTLALAAVYSERAQSLLKLQKFNEALGDVDRSLELDPTLAKSHFRRGFALFQLGEYFAAKAALQTGAGLVDGSSRNKFLELIAECDLLIRAAGDLDGNDGGGQDGVVNNGVGNLQDAEEEIFDGVGDEGNAVVNDGNLQVGDAEEVYLDVDALINDPEEANFHIDALFEDAQAVNQVDPAGDLGGNNGNFQIHAPEPPRTFLRKKLSHTDLFRSLLLTGGEDRIDEVVAQRLGVPLNTNELYPVLLHTAATEVPKAMNIKWGTKEGRLVSFLKWGTNNFDFTTNQRVIGYYWWADFQVQGIPQLHLSILPQPG